MIFHVSAVHQPKGGMPGTAKSSVDAQRKTPLEIVYPSQDWRHTKAFTRNSQKNYQVIKLYGCV